ncbi:hypothetical protein [Nocardia sp. NPDC050175]|uniref:hypothetical protein n=1 Tax=Nocardia sp. NPDC050175 TaxID=3364317 RepID=UPI0037A2E952
MTIGAVLPDLTAVQTVCLAVATYGLAALRYTLIYLSDKNDRDAVNARLSNSLEGVGDDQRAAVVRAQAQLEATQRHNRLGRGR